MNKSLSNQLRRLIGVHEEIEFDRILDEVAALAKTAQVSPKCAELLAKLRRLTQQISDSYDDLNRNLELRGRSLQLCSEELQNANLHILQISRTDALTGLYNRGYWQERFNEEFVQAQRLRQPACLVMMDIDHFKRINDTYGHPFGDEVLRMIARVFKDSYRKTDICGRYGGEEFAVIFPGTDIEGAVHISNHIRQCVEQLRPRYGETVVPVTISSGISALELNGSDDVSAWLKRSDQALYEAKAAGRNRVCVAIAPVHITGIAPRRDG